MNLNQTKLTKSEWNSIEIPVNQEEKFILQMIMDGFHEVNIRSNKNNSLFNYLKMDYNEAVEDYLYNQYFREKMNHINASEWLTIENIKSNVPMKKADKIRLEQNNPEKIKTLDIFEYALIDLLGKIKNGANDPPTICIVSYYTLHKLIGSNIPYINRHVYKICQTVLRAYEDQIDMLDLIRNAESCMEKNAILHRYSDIHLYEHQKKLFSCMKDCSPKLVLYIAPTGTGKTLSPIGLSEQYCVLFVCAARHVGLALAKSAISMNKRIGIAFGATSAADIRLHYFAAKDYTKNKRTGGIGKVDNSNGEKVQILICDIQSYLTSMYYLSAFNPVEDIVVYWDEPTIAMDYETHDLHPIIEKVWKENIIPHMILSSATLPKSYELSQTLSSFKEKFANAEIIEIISHETKKSIPLLNKFGYVVLPHTMNVNYEDLQRCVDHCIKNPSLLRYFDFKEVVEMVLYLNQENLQRDVSFMAASVSLRRYFAEWRDVNMKSIKEYYLQCLKKVNRDAWTQIYFHFHEKRKRRIALNQDVDTQGNKIRKSVSIGPGVSVSDRSVSVSDRSVSVSDPKIHIPPSSLHQGKPIMKMTSEVIMPSVQQITKDEEQPGIYITTKDAFTLTHGPTIFLAHDVEKIAKFCIQQANIPSEVMKDIREKIEFNNRINEEIAVLEKDLEDAMQRSTNAKSEDGNTKKAAQNPVHEDKNSKLILMKLEQLRSLIKTTQLNDMFVPNKPLHIKKWGSSTSSMNAVFTCDIDESLIGEIMLLNDVNDSWKILLMMGIGVFTEHKSIRYTEIMKKLADEQKLTIIIASSDFIYGTNYQFCHGYLSKDMCSSQEKIIQSLGRIGRNNIYQENTIRLRDEEQIKRLFYEEKNKIEVINMNRLFC